MWNVIAPSLITAAAGLLQGRRQEKMQREFAQQGVRWKVADAKAAGLSPLAGLGASTATYSPVNAVDFGALGQDVSRAMMAAASQRERDTLGEFAASKVKEQELRDQARHRETMQTLELERQRLALQRDQVQYALAASQLARMNQGLGPPGPDPDGGGLTLGAPVSLAGSAPARPVKGSAPVSGAIKVNPSEVTSRDRENPSRSAGSTPGFSQYEIWPGMTISLPSNAMAESLEGIGELGKFIGGGALTAAHGVGSWLHGREHGRGKPRDDLLPPGYRWQWNKRSQSWEAVR